MGAVSGTGPGAELATPRAGPGSVLVIACGALAREVLALQRANGLETLTLACLPAKLHNRPEQIPEAVRARIRRGRAEGFGRIFVLYADCGTGGQLDAVCAAEGVERIAGPHCYSFFEGNESFAARHEAGEITAFYLTDFLARQFDTLMWKGMGLDRHPELLPMIFGGYDRLVYLAQTDDPALTARAEAAAARLGLAFERRFTGYGELGDALARAAAP
ncbi:DUF1638 domain-containing protein [Paralimibaculum aggregatum]|uniref:DUF1638 domain-containing protein n=1 Tax=Paralimibaculum aggregatum TaxID=3036245 RepID=UPI0025523B80|nr:DUF1638 domain-containing protein [Limibaculum sp. NKW23]